MKLPHRTLTDFNLLKYIKAVKIPIYCGVFMRSELPDRGPPFPQKSLPLSTLMIKMAMAHSG